MEAIVRVAGLLRTIFCNTVMDGDSVLSIGPVWNEISCFHFVFINHTFLGTVLSAR